MRSLRFACMLTIFGLLATAVPGWAASREKVLHRFNGADGAYPYAGLIFDAAGNLYGTAAQGGPYGHGDVFKLTPGGNGKWTETVLHSFNGSNGSAPRGRLLFDSAGNLYGTTSEGGNRSGTVFKLTLGENGKWTETVLHSFNGSDGAVPSAGVIFDKAGNVYGTTVAGGNNNSGVVFELTPNAQGKWAETVLYAFTGPDGANPSASLVFDTSGNLYGTTKFGGGGNCIPSCGVVFQLTPGANGQWTERVLHFFDSRNDGAFPAAALILDSVGNLYGTTPLDSGCAGIVFRLEAPNWTETVLHCFAPNNPDDGAAPYAAVVFDKAGNLYGTTADGGNGNCVGNLFAGCGAVFELSPPKKKGGEWSEKVLHSFKGGADGARPSGDLILDSAGNLYGRSKIGGEPGGCRGGNGCGTVFEITP